MKQIIERAHDNPKEAIKKQRNEKIKELAKKVIVREEKQMYKDRYASVLEARKQALVEKAKEKKNELHDLILAIKTDKEKGVKGVFKI